MNKLKGALMYQDNLYWLKQTADLTIARWQYVHVA